MYTSLGGEILFLMHFCRGRDIPYKRWIYQGGEDIMLIRKLCSVCFLVGFMVLWVMFSIYALLFSLHRVCFGHAYIPMLLCFIECMFGWSFALICDHCSHFYMTVFGMIRLLICFTSCLLDCNLLVTLYLSFYYLLYLKGLMCFVQVF